MAQRDAIDLPAGFADEAARLFGNPSVPLLTMVGWVADWLLRGDSAYGKPTAFDSRDGGF